MLDGNLVGAKAPTAQTALQIRRATKATFICAGSYNDVSMPLCCVRPLVASLYRESNFNFKAEKKKKGKRRKCHAECFERKKGTTADPQQSFLNDCCGSLDDSVQDPSLSWSHGVVMRVVTNEEI